jgi:predicted metal-dependent hydrolase
MNLTFDDVTIRPQARKSLALRVTPDGLVALIPHSLDPADERVRRFIERGIARLPAPETASAPMSPATLEALIGTWAERLDVEVGRVQLREMRTKWASCSSQGTLTLHRDILRLPRDLVDYVLCHELLHRKVPNHNQGWELLMGIHLPDWRERERRLAAWMLREGDSGLSIFNEP